MRVVVLTGGDPTAAHMVARLREAGRSPHVIQVKWTRSVKRRPAPQQRALWRRLVRGIDRRLQGRYSEWRFARLRHRVAQELLGRQDFDVEADEVIEAHLVNSDAFAERMRELGPDLLLVNGAPLLDRSIFTIPRMGTLNVHFGMAPWYRGSFAQFWAIYERDFEHLGATLHFIDEGVDTGPVVGYALPERGPRDDEALIMARSAVGITDVIEKVLDRVASGGSLHRDNAPAGEATQKRAYRKHQRRFWHDLVLWFRRHRSSTEDASLPARQVLLF